MLQLPEEKTDICYCSFYDFIYKNKLDIYFQELKDEKFLNDLIFNLKFYKTAMLIIQNFNEEKIKSLNKSLLKELLYSINDEDIKSIKFLLIYLPEEFDIIIKKYYDNNKIKILKKLIREMNIKEKSNNKIIIGIEESYIKNFYIFKIKTYFNKQIDVLVEYIKNQREFEIFINLVLSKMKKNTINKLSYIINYAKTKGFHLPKIKNKKYIDLINEAQNNNNFIIQFQEDKFGPKTGNCIAYTENEINVIFIQKYGELIKNYELYFINSEFIGIDTEWRESLEFHIKTQTAIMQLSDYDGKNIFILDMIELIKDENFENNFENLFKNKKFISFGFKNDLETLPDKINIFFKEKAKIIDIGNLFTIKYFEKCPSFAKVCEKVIGKPLCKYEQCSNWERRPLRQSQLHYAALDSLLCCLIFKKIIENKS